MYQFLRWSRFFVSVFLRTENKYFLSSYNTWKADWRILFIKNSSILSKLNFSISLQLNNLHATWGYEAWKEYPFLYNSQDLNMEKITISRLPTDDRWRKCTRNMKVPIEWESEKRKRTCWVAFYQLLLLSARYCPLPNIGLP